MDRIKLCKSAGESTEIKNDKCKPVPEFKHKWLFSGSAQNI